MLSGVGGSVHRSPTFGTFADPKLQALLLPPFNRKRRGEFYYDGLVLFVLPILFCLPFLPTCVYILVNICRSAKTSKRKNSNWKPWTLQYPYLLFVNFTAISLIATVVYLYKISERPDPDPARKTFTPFLNVLKHNRITDSINIQTGPAAWILLERGLARNLYHVLFDLQGQDNYHKAFSHHTTTKGSLVSIVRRISRNASMALHLWRSTFCPC